MKTPPEPQPAPKDPAANCPSKFRVDCKVSGVWREFFTNATFEDANRVAEFMRRGQPSPGCVRVVAVDLPEAM